ncbi:hypothetical protein HHO41_21535 [Bacillus sp. DNRA2]|uniref:hypothetical protein n=1 Tax=Bacillus sp. DNRA2 TaxID=2723053 RepID=UPI00145F52C6|nr:hypothetical protein [Bacillus sp. DNRA2]NMD72808.1 hypothetical protein [Bacillus sp. DNRA2]
MEFSLCSLDSALPVEITIDEDNGRFMIRKSDMSGEVFNSPRELIEWVKSNFREDEFCDSSEFKGMMNRLDSYDTSSSLFG